MLKKRNKACPKCGSLEVVPIMYGYPMPEAMEAAERGEIELGGCCVGERDPQKYCRACGERFGWPRTPSRSAHPGQGPGKG
jgi:hypothetical protein